MVAIEDQCQMYFGERDRPSIAIAEVKISEIPWTGRARRK